MMEFAKRRNRLLTILIVVAILSWMGYAAYSATLVDTRFFTGWTLLLLIVALMLLNTRKKLPFLPIGDTSLWLQFHIYAGTFTILLCLMHIGFRVPSGVMDNILALILAGVLLSGFVGLLLTRRLPPRLATRGNSVIFERIPASTREIAREVEGLVLESVVEADSKAIPDYYAKQLKTFFACPRNFFSHIFELDRPRKIVVSGINELHRFASPREKEILQRISEKVIEKNGLDYQYALQLVLKGWLFVHIPLSYSLILAAFLHTYLAYYFRGDVP